MSVIVSQPVADAIESQKRWALAVNAAATRYMAEGNSCV
jgi:hypothetical protein